MPTKSIEARLASKLEAQKRLGEEIPELKREQAQKAKAERQRVERQIGRLAIQYGFDEWTQEELKAAFEILLRERHKQHPTGRGAHRGDDQVQHDEA
jgi:hypothetical protein